MTSDPKRHHYIPACYIARFSSGSETSRRLRRVAILRRTASKVVLQTAEQVGAINHFYRNQVGSSSDPLSLERTWSAYEDELTYALDSLQEWGSPTVTGRIWLRILVPFVAGLLVRGPDFNVRHAQRLESQGISLADLGIDEARNSNTARLVELQRLLAGVMAAKWRILHFNSASLISNDLGYGIRRHGNNVQLFGYVIPLNSRMALEIIPARHREVLQPRGIGGWSPIIEHSMGGDVDGLNRAIASIARDFVIGASDQEVIGYKEQLQQETGVPDPGLLGFPQGRLALAHENEWHRLVSMLRYCPGDMRVGRFEIDWDEVLSDWSPGIIYVVDLKRLPPTGLHESNGGISLTLHHVDGFSVNRSAKRERDWFKCEAQ